MINNTDMKILFTDLDDTLLNSDKEVSKQDYESISKMVEAGHKFVISTGRPLYSAYKLSKSLGFNKPGFYIIASNGGIVFDCTNNEVIMRRTVPFDIVEHLFIEAAKDNIHVQTYTDDYVVALKDTPEIRYYTDRIKMPYKILDNIPGDLTCEPPKVIVLSDEGRKVLEPFRKRLASYTDDKLNVVFSADNLLEFLPPESSKGNAVVDVCRILNVPIENAIAAGDQENDISMIDAAGIGVAVANATPEAKAHANYITLASNNENAITEVINKFILN